MIFLRLILAILVPTILGGSLLFLIFRKKRVGWPEFLILSFALGSGLTTYLMFWWGLAGLSLPIFVLALTVMAGILLIAIVVKIATVRPRTFKLTRSDRVSALSPRRKLTVIELILILVILWQIFFVFSTALSRPAVNFDALNIWVWKAKVFFYQPQQAFTPHSNLFLGGGAYQHYPLHIPLLASWTYLWLGQVDDVLVNLIFAFYWLALVAFVYFSLRRLVSRQTSLVFTVFLATLPLLVYHGFNAYADLPLAFYFTLAAIFLFKYLAGMSAVGPRTSEPRTPKRQSSDLILFGIFTGLTAWVKNEGLMLAGVLVVVLLIYLVWQKRIKISGKNFLSGVFYFLLLALPWIIFKKYFGLGYINVASGPFVFTGPHLEIFPRLVEQLFWFHSFHLWPGIFILILIINWRKIFIRPNYSHGRIRVPRAEGEGCAIRMLFLTILGVLAGYLIIYLFTPYYEYAVNSMAASRNFLVLMPLSIFLSAVLIGDGCSEPTFKA